jgi:hypothetical protein
VAQPESKHTSPSSTDGDGVRVIRESGPSLRPALVFAALALLAAGLGYWQLRPSKMTDAPRHAHGDVVPPPAPAAAINVEPSQPPPRTEAPMTIKAPLPAEPRLLPTAPDDARSGDSNDIATYVSPTDPEPTAAELIQALRDSGETGGLAAFNPPGTSPPMVGLAVPEDFPLPAGYVRHHQVTDDGQPIEAILMFAPDYVLRDAAGRVLPIPEDRVVPPELAPPGLALRQIEIPPPE